MFSLQQYFENRLKYLAALRAAGEEPYPHKFPVTKSIPEYVEQYKNIGNGEHLEDVTVKLAGIEIRAFIYLVSIYHVSFVNFFFKFSFLCKGVSWANVHLLQSYSFMIYMVVLLKSKLWLMLGSLSLYLFISLIHIWIFLMILVLLFL